jgi:membrane dipeptidase
MQQFARQLEERRKAGLSAPEEDRPTYVLGLNVPRRIEIICDQLLKRGYPAAVTEKVAGGNFARVFTQIWSA